MVDGGITVIPTPNIQHQESLNDAVAGAKGHLRRETCRNGPVFRSGPPEQRIGGPTPSGRTKARLRIWTRRSQVSSIGLLRPPAAHQNPGQRGSERHHEAGQRD
jgi:hypothetical protein